MNKWGFTPHPKKAPLAMNNFPLGSARNKFTILVDNREKEGFRWWFDEDDFCAGSRLATISTGDYTIEGLEDIVCIERKRNTAELSQNLIEDRFFKELVRMQSFKYRAIVCEFNMFSIINFPYSSGIPQSKLKFIKITPQFILSKITEIQVKYNVSFVFCDNAEYAMKYVRAFLKKIYQTVVAHDK